MMIAMKALACGVAAVSMALATVPAEAKRYGRHHHHHRHGGGLFLGGVGIGIGLGAGWPYDGGYVVPAPSIASDEVRSAPAAPEPSVHPRDGQSPAQLEGDRRACNRWAASQPAALADASEFHRVTVGCLEGRGYTVR